MSTQFSRSQTKTRHPELDLFHQAPGLWRFMDSETGSTVGYPYKTKLEALCDLERYASMFGCVNAAPFIPQEA